MDTRGKLAEWMDVSGKWWNEWIQLENDGRNGYNRIWRKELIQLEIRLGIDTTGKQGKGWKQLENKKWNGKSWLNAEEIMIILLKTTFSNKKNV